MKRAIPVVVLLTLSTAWLTASAQDKPAAVDWAKDWEAAFLEARDSDRPVMVCINSKDGESATERAAKTTYKDAEFVALSRKLVMIVISTRQHTLTDGTCPRFGTVTCEQHLNCWKELRNRHGDKFFIPGSSGEMISPQHAWFRKDGSLLRRKEYELSKAELMERMRAVLEEVKGQPVAPEGEGEGEGNAPAADAPLNERDQAELLRVRKGKNKEERRAACANLLATGKIAAREAVANLLREVPKSAVRCDVIHALGKARASDARTYIEQALSDKVALVRSFAAVALEELAAKESIEPLLKRVKKERDTDARRNMYSALGVCGGGSADEAAAKQILKGMSGDKHASVKKHCALALRHYEGAGAKFVVPKLEKAVLKLKDRTVRGAVVYTLAYIGNPRTTAPVLEKVLEKQRDDWGRRYVRTALSMVRGTGGDFGRSTWWLFAENREDPARQG